MSVQDLLNYIALQDEGFSRSVTEDIDGNVLERLEYLANRAGGAKKVQGSGYLAMPANAGVVVLSAGGSAWTKGSYSQITASTSEADYLVGIVLSGANSADFEVDIATGGAGSEAVISTIAFTKYTNVQGHVVSLPYPIAVGSGVRIAGRCSCSSAGLSIYVKLLYIKQSDLVAL